MRAAGDSLTTEVIEPNAPVHAVVVRMAARTECVACVWLERRWKMCYDDTIFHDIWFTLIGDNTTIW
jgi:hypothetical protein